MAALPLVLLRDVDPVFEGERGEHFFRSTLVQTLFYGLFSAWVLWTKTPPAQRPFPTFSWKGAMWSLGVPMIGALFHEIVTPTRTSRLDLTDVLDWAEATLDRIDPGQFFKRFEEEHAVQYFYEPFLEAFDPGLRKQLGVWYTPPEIVRYMVARVDTVLRTELGVSDGLADPNVYVLDPCRGTGAYLVEVLKHIHATQVANGMGALAGQVVKKAAEDRVFGFEILPAPFVVAHLQLGLTLDQALDRLGRTTCDVYLNDRLYWRNVPIRVWEFTIGGYQVIKKWLSYREYALLNRGLKLEEVQHVIGMARRLAAVRLLEPTLDDNYAALKTEVYPWPSATSTDGATMVAPASTTELASMTE